jgi:hypothetical protein
MLLAVMAVSVNAALLVTEQFNYTPATYTSTASGGNPPGEFHKMINDKMIMQQNNFWSGRLSQDD